MQRLLPLKNRRSLDKSNWSQNVTVTMAVATMDTYGDTEYEDDEDYEDGD